MKVPLFVGTILECIAWLSSQKEGLFEIFPHIKKRSLSANKLYWECVDRIARCEKKPKAYIHNILLRRLDIPEEIDGCTIYVPLPDTDSAELWAEYNELYHYSPTTQCKSGKRWYKMLKGSSQFNVEEMTRLIDLVIDELRNYGLPVPGEEDIRKAIEQYERTHKCNTTET